MKLKVTALMALLLCYPAAANVDCETLRGKTLDAIVTRVADGDTAKVKLKRAGSSVDVRFYGVDTPESKWAQHWPEQRYSREAKQFTVNSLSNQNVQVSFTGDGTYSRCVGEIFVNGESHSLALVTHGFAWWYSKYAPNRKDLKSAQYQAKRSKIGLWKDSDALAPWTYRWQHKN